MRDGLLTVLEFVILSTVCLSNAHRPSSDGAWCGHDEDRASPWKKTDCVEGWTSLWPEEIGQER